jgi:amino acid adenylation domain-containing protein
MEDSGMNVMVSKAEEASHLAACRPRLVLLDDPHEVRAIAAQPGHGLAVPIAPAQSAYVIYTSGSTGRPKGCVVEHRNVAALMTAAQARFAFGPDDAWTLFHSYAFDFSVWEMWGALLHGGRLVVVPWWVSRSPDAFAALIETAGVTVLNQTPSAFRSLMAPLAGLAHSLRVVIFGGEALQTQSLAPWYERHADDAPRLVNMFGITETTVHVTHRALGRADTGDGVGSVIGGALDHLRIYVLDERMEPVPAGVTGELYVGGAGVSRGYLGMPALTAQRFVPDPFPGARGGRLYRTGDLGRWLPDGSLEYLGRADQQIKVRGFRIEPGEIQATLCAHPQVAEALVVVVPGPGGDPRLTAYLVSAAPPTTDELRGFLLARLPEHMVPQVFVALDAFPLNHHGKIDRAALPPPGEPVSAARHIPPRTDTERRLAAVWQRVLRVSQVSVTDDFFSLGGDSILATQAIAWVREELGLDVPLQLLFEQPTLERIAAAIEELKAAPAPSAQPPVRRAQRQARRVITDASGEVKVE